MELKEQLEALTLKLEGKSKEEVKTAIEAFEAKNAEAIKNAVQEVKDAYTAEIKKVQDHADALDVKLQEQKKVASQPKDEIKEVLIANIDQISRVEKGVAGAKFELKAPMLISTDLTGDQPRTYDGTVADIPSPLVNFRDIVSAVNIGNGTLTFPQETGNTGTVGDQTEGADKNETTAQLTMVDVNTDFLAGYTRYSKKMANNLPFLESWLPTNLRRKYLEAENAKFYGLLSAAATASTVITGNVVERIIAEQVKLMDANFMPNLIVVNAADYGKILVTAGPAGTGDYSLPGVVSIVNGMVTINGVAVVVADWMPADKYIIGSFAQTQRVETSGLALNFFEQDQDNVIKNLITARIEAQVGLAVYRPDAFIFGDFTAVA